VLCGTSGHALTDGPTAEGERAIARLGSRLPTGWEDWLSEPAWPALSLPDELESVGPSENPVRTARHGAGARAILGRRHDADRHCLWSGLRYKPVERMAEGWGGHTMLRRVHTTAGRWAIKQLGRAR